MLFHITLLLLCSFTHFTGLILHAHEKIRAKDVGTQQVKARYMGKSNGKK